ncbi:MAG: cytochrome c family protein [Hyphomicrobiales bacterium]|nr:cytochrome c family protein [Hyphomicrobiales bacterium]
MKFASGLSIVTAAGLAMGLALPAAAAGDPAAGAKVFQKCRVCHQIGPGAQNAVGPVLNGVVGRHSGIYPGYSYSDANKKSGIVWTVDVLQKYLKSPQSVVHGTKMMFPGLQKQSDIDNVIAYLQTFDAKGNPVKPGAAPAAAAPAAPAAK